MRTTEHGHPYRHVGRGPAQIINCKKCGDDLINKHKKFPFERGWVCLHCHTLLVHGKSDSKTCFQGSVIPMED